MTSKDPHQSRPAIPPLEDFPIKIITPTKEAYTPGGGRNFIDNCYYHKMIDEVLYANDGDNQHVYATLHNVTVYAKMLLHPCSVVTCLRFNSEYMVQGGGGDTVLFFSYGLYDVSTHVCHAFGERVMLRTVPQRFAQKRFEVPALSEMLPLNAIDELTKCMPRRYGSPYPYILPNSPTLDDFPYRCTLPAKAKYVLESDPRTTLGPLIHECFHHRICDNGCYEATRIKEFGYPSVYFVIVQQNFSYTSKVMTFPCNITLGLRVDSENDLLRSALPFHAAVFDEATGECCSYGVTVAVLTQLKDNNFKPTPIADDFRKHIASVVLRKSAL